MSYWTKAEAPEGQFEEAQMFNIEMGIPRIPKQVRNLEQ
jgi:hypothetical protein